MKTLIVVESPSKATTIQKYLGKDFLVVASFGHITDLAKGAKFGIGIDINNNFKPHYVLMKDKIKVLDEIIEAAVKCDRILLASDPDLEGESISWHLFQHLNHLDKPIQRIVFHEITKKEILSAIENATEINMNQVKAQEARRLLDRIVGFMASPMLMSFYGANLSAGRVQSVAVRMIVDREKEIESFQPEEYWNIHSSFQYDGTSFSAKLDKKIANQQEAVAIVQTIKSSNDFYLAKVQVAKKKEKPPPPLITSKLQQLMAKKFGFDAERTMKSAQTLYENGYCTYIRTDSTRISDDAIKAARHWLQENQFDIPKTPFQYSAKTSAQDAHECIRPTNVKTSPNDCLLSGDDKEVYRAIWQFFLASQMNSAIWQTLSVKITSRSNSSLCFRVSGKALEYKGFLAMFDSVETGKIDLPNLKEGDALLLLPNTLRSEQKFTQPPSRFSKFSFLKELEDNEIGRPSTYQTIVKKVFDRGYVELDGNIYRPTELGKKITNILAQRFSFMQYNFTSDLEKMLDTIAEGKTTRDDVLRAFYAVFHPELMKSYLALATEKKTCTQCHNLLLKRTGKFGEFYACVNCKRIEKQQTSPTPDI